MEALCSFIHPCEGLGGLGRMNGELKTDFTSIEREKDLLHEWIDNDSSKISFKEGKKNHR